MNREVKIRRGRPGFEGQQTDIYVDAMSSATESGVQERIRVVLEVKGCWNNDVRKAMKTQLADRYLHAGACTHGLYVVGWFMDNEWARLTAEKWPQRGCSRNRRRRASSVRSTSQGVEPDRQGHRVLRP